MSYGVIVIYVIPLFIRGFQLFTNKSTIPQSKTKIT